MQFLLDELKLKTSSQLNDDEKNFIREHSAELNDEDREAYSSFLDTSQGSSKNENGEDASSESGGENSEGEKSEESSHDGKKKENDNGESEQSTKYVFSTEEEAKEFVRKQVEDNEKAKQAAIDAAKTPEEKRYVEDNWKPANWNEAMKLAVEHAKKEIVEEQVAATKKEEENAKKLQAEWEEVSKANSIPALTTKEGREIHDQIVKLAIAHNKTNFKDAHLLWSQTAKEFGGGYDPVKTATKTAQDKQKADAEARRKGAAKIGAQNAGAGATKGSASLKAVTYEDIHGKSRAKVLKEALNG